MALDYKKTYYQLNKEKIKKNNKIYYQNNKEKAKELRKRWYENNKEHFNEQRKEWAKNNKDKISDYKKKYRENNREKINKHTREYGEKFPEKRTNHWLKSKYGITLDQRNKMIDEQKGLCALCKKPLGDITKNIHTDHDHKTGKVRGILHSKCNLLISHANEDVNILLKGIKYLNRNKDL